MSVHRPAGPAEDAYPECAGCAPPRTGRRGTGRWRPGSEIYNAATFVNTKSLNRSVSHGRRRNGGHPRLNPKTLLNENHMNKDNLTPTGDGTSKPDTDHNTNPNPNAEAPNKSDGSQTSPPQPSISEARLRANRENAKKSTGPKTARGKAYSRRNALKHGLLIDRVLFSSDGAPMNEELHDLWDSLQAKYGSGDVGTELLLETLLVEWWRLRMALDIEMRCLKDAVNHLGPMGSLPNLQRYRTSSQRAFLKNLELLDKRQPPTSEAAGDEAEGDAPASQPETPPQAPKPTSGLTVMATEASAPKQGSESHEASSGEDSTSTGDVEEAA